LGGEPNTLLPEFGHEKFGRELLESIFQDLEERIMKNMARGRPWD
jgi:hypothetical protein